MADLQKLNNKFFTDPQGRVFYAIYHPDLHALFLQQGKNWKYIDNNSLVRLVVHQECHQDNQGKPKRQEYFTLVFRTTEEKIETDEDGDEYIDEIPVIETLELTTLQLAPGENQPVELNFEQLVDKFQGRKILLVDSLAIGSASFQTEKNAEFVEIEYETDRTRLCRLFKEDFQTAHLYPNGLFKVYRKDEPYPRQFFILSGGE